MSLMTAIIVVANWFHVPRQQVMTWPLSTVLCMAVWIVQQQGRLNA